ncbi:hypothetical protein [Xaviernesmea oryzae]|uniref:Uncharacterized protein n=2 Tax=Rhizobium/Agrobacterium group TaxID=227290 RepID=A0A1X7ESS4_9HYPH|nr:hypothetical protein SAMN02982989_1675 [Xaviernesmea oryzae]
MNTRFDPKDAGNRDPNRTGSPAEEPMSATEARQGRWGMPVLMVLVAGLILAMLAWGGAEWWGEATAPPAEQTATPPAGSTTPQNPNAAPSADPATPPAPTPPATGAPANNNP